MKIKKLLIVPSLVAALVSSAVLPSAPLAAEKSITQSENQVKELSSQQIEELSVKLNAIHLQINQGQGITGINENVGSDGMSNMGVKSKAATKVADLLLKAEDETVDLLDAIGLLDKAAAKSFKRVTGKVGKFVDSIASAGDSAAAMARKQLPAKLKSWGIKNKGIQEMIANSVSYAIKAADWLFL